MSSGESNILEWWKYQYQDTELQQPDLANHLTVPTREEVNETIKQLGSRKTVGPGNCWLNLSRTGENWLKRFYLS
ncbi:unnamed protein product [Blepharisma stoltei]|uniref:Uncharacterized protein n=1 Tax=Blepharisma stoltei TaxID=1481888 RepID=A0AAU9KCC1_9CILI|nr:unnamed protein product [Blepharisma stoltei]